MEVERYWRESRLLEAVEHVAVKTEKLAERVAAAYNLQLKLEEARREENGEKEADLTVKAASAHVGVGSAEISFFKALTVRAARCCKNCLHVVRE